MEGEDGGARGLMPLPNMRLDDLLGELQARLEAVLATRDRFHGLLEAVVSIGTDLDLETVLRRIVKVATTLVDARYGALGVIGDGGQLARFIPVGLSEEEIARIAEWPHGRGLLGLLIKEPHTLRLAEISDHPESFGFPPGHPPMRSFLGVPIRVRGEAFGNIYLTEKQGGGQFDEEDEAILVALATAAGVAIENARLYEVTRMRERWLEASAEVTTSLFSGADPAEVLSAVARRAREMAEAEVAAILLPHGAADTGATNTGGDDTGGDERLMVEVVDGPGAEQLHGAQVAVSGSLTGTAFRSGESIPVTDIADRAGEAPLLRRLPIGPVLVTPLGAAGRARGVLVLARRPGGVPFSAASVRMLEAYAGQAGVALELSDARRDAERLGLLEDRDRIAKDLHDVVIQRLFATAMTLTGAVRMAERPEVADRIRHAVDDLDETIRQIRSTIFALQAPSAEAGVTVRGRIMGIVDAATEQLGFSPGVRLEGYPDTAVSDGIAEHLLAALREALSNVARHAGATRVDVLVDARDELLLRVVDNGGGIAAGGRRSGLANLASRAERLGGGLSISPGERGGTVLEWRVPL